MASLSDLPRMIHRTGFWGFLKRVWKEIGDDDVFTWGSALAYAWIFAIFPFMVFMLTLAPYLPGNVKQQAIDQTSNLAYSSVGGGAADTLVSSIIQVMSHEQGGLLSIGLVLALWGASGGMTMTMSALDRAYYVTCSRSFIKQRLIATALTVASAVLILLVVFLLPIGARITTYLQHHGVIGGALVWVIDVGRYIVAIAMLIGIVGMIFYFGPCIKQKWHAITPGAIFTVVVWLVLGFAFSFYVSHFGNFNKTYGALGAAIILLLFFYINAVVLLIGAEVNSAIDFETLGVRHGERDFTHPAEHPADQAGSPGKAPDRQERGEASSQRRAADRGYPAPRPAVAHYTSSGPGKPARRWKWVTALFITRWVWRRFGRPRLAGR